MRNVSWRMVAAGLVLGACAKAPPSYPVYRPARAEPDWEAMTKESTLLLQALISIPSVNPVSEATAGNERKVADLLAEVLRAEGVEALVEESAPGRGNVLARLSGDGSKRPILLLCHLDVVPVEPSGWTTDPFAGTLRDGYLWGRGALDDKGMCTANLMAFLSLKRQNVPLARDVIFLATADEESGGTGVLYMLQQHPKELEAEYLLNEGGLGLVDAVSKGQTLFAISVAEKGTAGLHLYADGKPGHGSTPRPDQAADRLVDALEALSNEEPELVLHSYIEELVRRVGATKGGVVGFLMRHPRLAKRLILKKLAASPPTRASISDTQNLTMLKAGEKINVVPGRAEAWIDARLLPGTSPEEMRTRVDAVVREFGVTVELLDGSNPATASPWDTELFRALERHMVDGVPNCIAAPIVSPGYTDSRPFRERGVIAYGVLPFVVTQDEFTGMHGNNERIKISELVLGVRRLYRVLIEVAAK